MSKKLSWEQFRAFVAGATGLSGGVRGQDQHLEGARSRTDTSRRLRTMPGVRPLTALAIEAFAPDMAQFKKRSRFRGWLGRVPRQHSTGGQARLERISKAGQANIRRLLITSAMTRIMGRAP